MNIATIQNEVNVIIGGSAFAKAVRDAIVYETEAGETQIDVNVWNEDVQQGNFYECNFEIAAKESGIEVEKIGGGDGDGVRIFTFKVLEVR